MKRLSLANYLLPDFGTLLAAAIFLGVLGLGPRLLNMDGDLGRHITIGKFILDKGYIPLQDYFSFTMTGQALVPHEWFAQVCFALVYRWAGLDGIVLLCGLLIALTTFLVFNLSSYRSQGVSIPILVTVVGAAASSLHWLARPHLFTLVFLSVWMWLLNRLAKKQYQVTWIFPVIMLLWANTHGAFISGFVSWFIFGFGQWIDRISGRVIDTADEKNRFYKTYILAGGASFLTSLINPSGFDLWRTSVGYLQSRYLVSHTAEYLPPDFQSPSTWPFLIMILLSLLVLGLREKKVSTNGLLLVTAWTAMSLVSARNIPLYAIIASPYLTEWISGWIQQPHIWIHRLSGLRIYDHLLAAMQRGMRGYIWLFVVWIVSVILLKSGGKMDFLRQGNQFSPAVFPVQAANWMNQEGLSNRVFNYFPWGGYLLYRFWPNQQVFIDGQTDFYGEDLTRKYETVITGSPGWDEILDTYQIESILIPSTEGLGSILESSKSWIIVYRDETAVVLKRNLQPR